MGSADVCRPTRSCYARPTMTLAIDRPTFARWALAHLEAHARRRADEPTSLTLEDDAMRIRVSRPDGRSSLVALETSSTSSSPRRRPTARRSSTGSPRCSTSSTAANDSTRSASC